jgi:dynein heavy chain
MNDDSFQTLVQLDNLKAFAGIFSSIEQNEREWKNWYLSLDSEDSELPDDWGSKLNDFQKLILFKSLKPARIRHYCSSFIDCTLGAKFLQSTKMSLDSIVDTRNLSIPFIIILSEEESPCRMVQKVAESKGMSSRLVCVSLGAVQPDKVHKLVFDGARDGNWVMLSECHMYSSWMPQLSYIVESIQTFNVHKDFKLYLATTSVRNFPISMLMNGTTLIFETSSGIKSHILRILGKFVTEDTFNRSSKPRLYQPLLFSLCILHSILLERRNYNTLGWNVQCFNPRRYASLMTMILQQVRKY